MQKYKIREKIPEKAQKSLGDLPDLVKHLLYYRGIDDLSKAQMFLNPDYEKHSFDPFLFKDIDKVLDRIFQAIDCGQKIGIFSDYDADGIPGAVILSDFFNKINYENFTVYIPHRNDEGYGLNESAIKSLSDDGVVLLITIDCGISDHKMVDFANSLKMEVIITDHHLPHDSLPNAFAIINPKRQDCHYPEKMLCGAGVVYKIICAIISDKRFEKIREKNNLANGFEKWFLDMAGLATLSDMVPLLGENRNLAYFGLKVLQKSPRSGLLKLFSLLKIDQRNLNEDDIGFLVTPRINVASRMGHPKDAFLMLSSKDEILSTEMATHLHKINEERKGLVSSMSKEIKKIIEQRQDVLGDVLVLGNPNWKPSLLGLVANSFLETYGKPVFLWGKEDGSLIKGSCRSSSVSVVDLMKEVSFLFEEYGGHLGAGGFSISQEKIHLLPDALNEAFKKISTSKEENVVWIDKVLYPDDVSWHLWESIKRMAPFGISNHKPVFMFENIDILEVKHFGKDKNHLQVCVLNSKGFKIKAIAFFKKEEDFKALSGGQKKNLIFNLERSDFRNIPELRLRIIDII